MAERQPPMIGVDILDPARLQERLARTVGLDETLFTRGELSYCRSQFSPHESLAARFCAKEAVVKALGLDGWDPLDIEVVSGGSEVGVVLHGAVLAEATRLGVRISISMAHLPNHATAVAYAVPVEQLRVL